MANLIWPADPYVWIDPAEAVFTVSCREALKIERQAWREADEERRALRAEVERLKEGRE